MGEILDLVSFGDTVIGQVDKDVAHETGALHRAVHLWIVTKQNDGIKVLLQKRGDDKRLLPGLLDVSAAGHLQLGEDPVAGMLRECEEELGFCPKAEELMFLGRRVELYEDALVRNFEISYVYLMRQQKSLRDYRLAFPEVSGLYFAEITELLALLEGKRDSLTLSGLRADKNGQLQETTITAQRNSFVPRVDPYLEKLLLLIPRFLAGEQTLYI